MSTALVLAAHGSHLDPRSSEAVRVHARALAGTGVADEVLLAFWKEEPSLARALDGCTASEVTVVPFFMSEGYFTSEVIPAEMCLDGPVTRREGRTVRLTRPVGIHPALAEVVVERALEAGATPDGAVFVLGHGTPRNAASAGAVAEQVERIRALDRFAHVAAVYTDQDPSVAAIPALAGGRSAVVVPYFASDGWHVGQVATDTDAVRYAAPAGTHPAIVTVIADLAGEAAGA